MIPDQPGWYWATPTEALGWRYREYERQLVYVAPDTAAEAVKSWCVFMIGRSSLVRLDAFTDWHGPIVESCRECEGDGRNHSGHWGDIMQGDYCPSCGGSGRRRT